MQYAIIISKKDLASINIGERLLDIFDFKKEENNFVKGNIKLYFVDKESIYCNDLNVNADVVIFATKHQSKVGKPSLSVHVPGNWAKAEMGGKDNFLNIAPASLVKEMYIELVKQSKGFEGEITLEATHHGPALDKPVLFIEIGSNKKEWQNKSYGKIIANTIINVLSRERKKFRTCFAIGGGHYPRSFNKVLLRTPYAISHICPKYMLQNLDKSMAEQAIEKTFEKVDFILLDWKGLSGYKDKVKKILEELDMDVKRVKHLLK